LVPATESKRSLKHQHDASFGLQTNFFKTFKQARTVYIATQADLGEYSLALGSAQLLIFPRNAMYASFGNGLVSGPRHAAQSVEVDLNGNIVYGLEVNTYPYRSYHVQDLYTLAHPQDLRPP
jgi:hypothetical protein